MSATMHDLHALGLNPFAVQLLAESMLKSAYVKHCGTQPLTFAYLVQREDCAGWLGVRITIEAVAVDEQPQAEAVPDEVQHVLNRLNSSDPDFDDCAAAAALIQQMADALRSCSGVPHWPAFQPLLAEASRWQAEAVPGLGEFLTDLNRSRTKYPNNARMWDGLMGEVDELRRAYHGDGDQRAEAFDVAVCAFRIATEGDAGGNTLLAAPQQAEDHLKLHAVEELCQLGYTVKDGELFPPDHLHKLMEAAGHPLAAPQQAEAVPSTHVLVPVEPTKEMLLAGSADLRLGDCIGTIVRASECWRAMLAAAKKEAGHE